MGEDDRTRSGMPPRRDLRMEAMVDILDQRLLCRRTVIVPTSTSRSFASRRSSASSVQTLQHGVEAYKIASELEKSDVAAVVWSDWGAFKLEAYDATKYNARMLMEAGVVTVAPFGQRARSRAA